MKRPFSSFGTQWDIQRQFANAIEQPDNLLKTEFVEKVKRMAELLEETMKTRGWKEIIQPYIENQLTPDKLLKATEDEKKELMAFNKILKLARNITNTADKARQMEERRGETD